MARSSSFPQRLVAAVPFVLAAFGSSVAHADELAPYQRLVHAIVQDQPGEVKALLDKGLDANAKVAPAKEDGWVIQDGGDPAPPLLVLAARFGVPESPEIRLLVDHGAKVNVADKSGRTPLMNAAELGWTPALEMLFEKRAEVNARDAAGKTVLMYAMGNRKLGTAAALVAKG